MNNLTPLRRLELCYLQINDSATMNDFMLRIDATGGWPLGYTHLSWSHSDTRDCMFTTSTNHNEWWSHVITADEYYWWKISQSFKDKIAKQIRKEFTDKIYRII
jgi:hypothetical protein